MMKSMLEVFKLVQHLADYVEIFGTEVESDVTQSWKFTDRWCCQHYYTHANLDNLSMECQKTEPLLNKLS